MIKMRDAEVFYRILSLFVFTLSSLLLIRRLLIVQFDLFQLLLGLAWPLIGLYIGIKFLNPEGYTMSLQEGLFYLFILYCSLYFLIDTILVILFAPQDMAPLIIISLNVIITVVGWSGILTFIFV